MITLWAKMLTDNKIIKTSTLELDVFDRQRIAEYLTKISYELDISTPIVLAKHIAGFDNYSSATFLPDDFMETVHFDKLVVELF